MLKATMLDRKMKSCSHQCMEYFMFDGIEKFPVFVYTGRDTCGTDVDVARYWSVIHTTTGFTYILFTIKTTKNKHICFYLQFS